MTLHSGGEPKRLLVTGATGGMGRTCAEQAAKEGYQLVLADLNAQKLETVAAHCQALGVTTEQHVLDVTRQDSISSVAAAIEACGGVDAIIHTVGVSPQMAPWDRIIEIDLVGTILFLEAARPHLRSGGCAVAISSMSAYMVPPDEATEQTMSKPLQAGLLEMLRGSSSAVVDNPGLAYAYSKQALMRYVVSQAKNWGKENKRFVSISPGLIDTEQGRLESAAMENFEAMRSHIALERLGNPEDIANTALFLASNRAAYITGCDIRVDGGFVASLGRG